MDCDNVQQKLNAWCDFEVETEERLAIDEHLASCADCRQSAEVYQSAASALRNAFQPERQAADALATRVVDVLHSQNPTSTVPAAKLSPRHWLSLLLATMAGFLTAIIIFPPWKAEPTAARMPAFPSTGPDTLSPDNLPPSVAPPIALLVAATGNVELRANGREDWQTPQGLSDFHCPSDTGVRTGPSVRCELQTSDGCVVRLNADTEITMRTGRELELRRGQIWCLAPPEVTMQIVAANAEPKSPVIPPTSNNSAADSPLWCLSCPANASLTSQVAEDGKVQVTTAQGEIVVLTGSERQKLERGQSATIVGDRIAKTDGVIDPILDVGWIHPLLTRKGVANDELRSRVDELTARIGLSKLSVLYEREIRSLGEYAVLPLLRFVESPLSQQSPEQRIAAMRILADIAPSWAIAELINLLPDDNPHVRFYSATALERLTGETQGLPADAWREAGPLCVAAHARWESWWAIHSANYPLPVFQPTQSDVLR